MGSSNGKWRDDYYVADLESIMNILGDLERDQGLDSASKDWLDTGVFDVRPDEVSFESSTSLPLKSSRTFSVGALPISPTTPTSMNTFLEDVRTQVSSPTEASQSSISPRSPVYVASTARVVKVCPNCGEKFTGSPSDTTKNLKRHMTPLIVLCPQPDCTSNPMREDNLSPHLKRVHGFMSPQELEQAKKKSKVTSTVHETGCSPPRCSFLGNS